MKTPVSVSSHLTDTQYLLHFLKLNNIRIEQYHEYCQHLCTRCESNEELQLSNILQEHSINILPYLFTSHIIQPNVFNRFLVYCSRYTDVLNYEVHDAEPKDMHMFRLLTSDLGNMVVLLLLMQYYFL